MFLLTVHEYGEAMTVEECLEAIQAAYQDYLGVPGGHAYTCAGVLALGSPECVRIYGDELELAA
jgi:hypothetical protein